MRYQGKQRRGSRNADNSEAVETSSGKAVADRPALLRLDAVLVITILLGSGFYSEPWLELVESSTRALNMPFVELDGAGGR